MLSLTKQANQTVMSASAASPYSSFAKVLTAYHDRYAEAGSSSSQLDTPIRVEVVLDEEGGLISALMKALEESCVCFPITCHCIQSRKTKMRRSS